MKCLQEKKINNVSVPFEFEKLIQDIYHYSQVIYTFSIFFWHCGTISGNLYIFTAYSSDTYGMFTHEKSLYN